MARVLVASLPQHDVAVAAAAQSADLGCVRRLDLRDGVVALLVHRTHTGLCDDARPGETRLASATHLRHPGDGLAELRTALAEISEGIPSAGRPFDSPGGLRA